jgi:cation-transporting ATPase E
MTENTTDEIEMRGLTAAEVESRKRHGLVNTPAESGTKSEKEIIRENLLTYFNIIFVILAILVCIAGRPLEMTFMLVVVANALIGIVQQIRSKKAVDQLTILAEKKVTVIRAEGKQQIPSSELVRDDVVEISGGMQIPADAVILRGKVKVNESLLTGEEDDLERKVGEELHSGSVCTSGEALVRLTAVGNESYASRLSREATTNVKTAKSDMMASLDKLIKVIGFLLIPVGILLYYNEYFIVGSSFSDAIVSMVAALVGMIPEGLYLLTSVALAASVLRLSQKKVLVRDLNCVETLARVDTLCVDKTGTITEPGMKLEKIDVLNENMDEAQMKQLIGSYAQAFYHLNDTMKALQEACQPGSYYAVSDMIPFNSERKYSAVKINSTWYVLGAPQFIAGSHMYEVASRVHSYAAKGLRVLLLGTCETVTEGEPVKDLKPEALVVISNNVRKSAPETFAYFKKQGVAVKVISGDDAETVSQIAAYVGIEGAEAYVDSSTLKDDEAIEEAVQKYTVFGRTTPDQKKKMVLALKAQGHHVAMTGDGVNDVLALKEADCGIAMASGSDAASQIAQLVLLNSDFAAVPDIVLEGRRVINNIERSAMLFLSKNIFSIGLSLLCVLLGLSYPLTPLQLSFISSLTIGIPGFFLAMQPNDGLIRGRFIPNVLYRAFPGGICELLVVGGLIFYADVFGLKDGQINTMAVIAAFVVGMLVLSQACKPWNKYRAGIFIGMITVTVFVIYNFYGFMGLHPLSMKAWMILVLFLLLVLPTMRFLLWIILWLNRGYNAIKRRLRRA